MPLENRLYTYLTPEIADLLRALPAQEAERLEEIRIGVDANVCLRIAGERIQTPVRMHVQQMGRLLAALSGGALYSCERQMAMGYIPLEGGHRAGVCGTMTQQEDGKWAMSRVTSILIRISRSIRGASMALRPHLLGKDGRVRSTLLLGGPGCGKTTVLRDAARWLCTECGLRVAAADEREELFGGEAGTGIDVLSGIEKAAAIPMLIRSMAPDVIIADEIGAARDALALCDAARCGVSVLASAHAGGLEDMQFRPALCAVMKSGAFEQAVLLGAYGAVKGVRDLRNGRAEEECHDKLGCGGYGDDRCERGGLSDFRRREAPRTLDTGDAPVFAAHERRHPL